MDIGAVSSNTFVSQVSGLQSGKQLQQNNSNDDANIISSLETSQNIGNVTERPVEDVSDSNSSNSAESNESNDSDVGSILDVIA